MLNCFRLSVLAFSLAVIGFQSASAQTITSFPVTTPNSSPVLITAGPDGALWFTENATSKIGKITTAGVVTEYPTTTPASQPNGITTGPDGNLWFTETAGNKIGKITTAGTVTEYPIVTVNSQPFGIAAGPDGNLWFAESGATKIARITPAGVITEFTAGLSANSQPKFITAGPDGNMWFTEFAAHKIGKITMAGVITEYNTVTPVSQPQMIVTGPDGNLWFTEYNAEKIGKITPAGVVTEYPIPGGGVLSPYGIAVGADGNLWFTEQQGLKIGRITTAGTITQFPGAENVPLGIAAGSDGALWFTEAVVNKIGRISTLGLTVTPALNISTAGNAGGPFAPDAFEYLLQSTSDTTNYTITGVPTWLTASATNGSVNRTGTTITFTVNDAAKALAPATYGPTTITFTNATNGQGTTTRTATLTVGNYGTTSMVSAVLPASRSVQVGTAATAFGTIINSGANMGVNCGLSLGTNLPADFAYQTTNPATNTVTGTLNVPVNIPAGGSQSYVFAVDPSGPFSPTEVVINTICANAPMAPSVIGLNTLLMSASAAPVPDIVALGATVSNDGIVNVPSVGGSGAFAVATVNVGIAAAITASVDTGAATLPVEVNLCQTNPGTGQCTSAIGPTVTTTIVANATPTFAIFVKANAAVAFDPAHSRIFVRFKDSGGVTRGATSVAVRTP